MVGINILGWWWKRCGGTDVCLNVMFVAEDVLTFPSQTFTSRIGFAVSHYQNQVESELLL